MAIKDRIARLYANVRQDVRMFGWGAFSYFLDRILARTSAGNARLYKYWIVAQPIDLPTLKNARSSGGAFQVRPVTESDARYDDYPRPAEVIRARFRQGGQCVAAYRHDVFVGYIWFNVGPYCEDEVRCRFVPRPQGQAAWDYDAFVAERYRLGRAFKLLWSSALASLYAQGVRVSYSRISAYNAPSLAAHKSLGARRIGTLFVLCLGGTQWMVGTLRPYVSMGIASSRVPTLFVGSERCLLCQETSATRID